MIFLILSTALTASLTHVPLDERFATRVAFLNLARLTDFTLNTLPEQLLPSRKNYSDPDLIGAWVSQHPADAALLSL